MKTALELVNPRVFELPTARDNIFFDVVHQELMRDPVNHIQEFLQEKLSTGGSSIVYVRTKDQASSLCRSLNQMNLSSTEYHRGLSEDTCKQNQQPKSSVTDAFPAIETRKLDFPGPKNR